MKHRWFTYPKTIKNYLLNFIINLGKKKESEKKANHSELPDFLPLREGPYKGGVNNFPPSTPRPPAPKGQGKRVIN